jgi:hypothetical protein
LERREIGHWRFETVGGILLSVGDFDLAVKSVAIVTGGPCNWLDC